MPAEPPCLFALDATRAWGEAVARSLPLALAPHEEQGFEDGEHKLRPLENVRGRDVFVLQSLHADAALSVDDKLCRLLFFIGALRDASAASITAVVPYLGYARKDRQTQPRDPVATRYIATLFEAVGTDRMLTLDVHNVVAYQNAFRCRAEHLEAQGLFADHLVPRLEAGPVAVVSPDLGGLKRAEALRQRLAQRLDRPVGTAFVEKHRSNGAVRGELFAGEVAGRRVVIVDDMIGTGTTIARAAAACRARGATAVLAVATHGLFTGDAARTLADPGLDGIVVTDTVPPFRLPSGPVRDKLTVLPATGLFAEAIRCIHTGGSLPDLMQLS